MIFTNAYFSSGFISLESTPSSLQTLQISYIHIRSALNTHIDSNREICTKFLTHTHGRAQRLSTGHRARTIVAMCGEYFALMRELLETSVPKPGRIPHWQYLSLKISLSVVKLSNKRELDWPHAGDANSAPGGSLLYAQRAALLAVTAQKLILL